MDMILLPPQFKSRSGADCRAWAWNREALRLSRKDFPRMRATAATCVQASALTHPARLKTSLNLLTKLNCLLAFCSKRA